VIGTALVSIASGAVFSLAEHLAPMRPRRRLREAFAHELPYIVFASMLPALVLGWLGATLRIEGPVGHAPLVVQWLVVLAITELSFYAAHRAMHRVRWLWPLHRLHHTPDATSLDWLAGFRKHVGEALLHGFVLLPFLVVLAPSPAVIAFNAALGIAMNAFIHANVRVRLVWLERVIVTPRYHAWHHAADPRAQRANLAAKLPFLDRLFRTHHDAAGWPDELGLGAQP
jgi:sterol desaturase/sphingolipid hydroxylase (fatty acid hydroxylase superfamily)